MDVRDKAAIEKNKSYILPNRALCIQYVYTIFHINLNPKFGKISHSRTDIDTDSKIDDIESRSII